MSMTTGAIAGESWNRSLSLNQTASAGCTSRAITRYAPPSRPLATKSAPPSIDAIPPLLVYRRHRRGYAFFMSALAGTQASFWGYTAYLSQQVPNALLSPPWTLGGLVLSTAFAGMVHLYLRRSVAEISILDGSAQRLQVSTHAFGGRIGKPVDLDLGDIVGGPKKDDADERYWTFAVRREGRTSLHYIVDTRKGVVDAPALAALARGGEHVLALAHRRRAAEMQGRWQEWEAGQGAKGKATAQ